MINEKVISAVFNNQEVTIIGLVDNDIEYSIDGIVSRINIYELAHKCKEWAFDKGYEISSYIDGQCGVINRPDCGIWVRTDTEPNAIFEKCEWVLENLSNL